MHKAQHDSPASRMERERESGCHASVDEDDLTASFQHWKGRIVIDETVTKYTVRSNTIEKGSGKLSERSGRQKGTMRQAEPAWARGDASLG